MGAAPTAAKVTPHLLTAHDRIGRSHTWPRARTCLVLAALLVYPIVYSLILSFSRLDGLSMEFVRLANYAGLLLDEDFWRVLLNNFIFLRRSFCSPRSSAQCLSTSRSGAGRCSESSSSSHLLSRRW